MITRKDIGDLYIQICNGKKTSAKDAVLTLLLKSLSPAQETAYGALLHEDAVSSVTLNKSLGWKLNYAGNILASLYNLGLAAMRWSQAGKIKEYYLPEEEQ